MENGFKSRNRGFLPTAGERTISEAVLATGVLDNVLCGLSTAAPTPPPPSTTEKWPNLLQAGLSTRQQPAEAATIISTCLQITPEKSHKNATASSKVQLISKFPQTKDQD